MKSSGRWLQHQMPAGPSLSGYSGAGRWAECPRLLWQMWVCLLDGCKGEETFKVHIEPVNRPAACEAVAIIPHPLSSRKWIDICLCLFMIADCQDPVKSL